MKINKKFIGLSLVVFLTACGAKTELEFSSSSLADSLGMNAKYMLKLQVTDREFTTSVIKKAFNINSGSTSETWINRDVNTRSEFGGGCDPYRESDLGANIIEFPSESCGRIVPVVTATNNPMRYGLTMKTCEFVTNQPENMNEIKLKLFGTQAWAAPDAVTIEKAWGLFYPADKINEETNAALKDIGIAAKDSAEAWKLILFTLCSSPGWQSF
ncbi:MAG: hypothetical protein H7235_09385 [Bdellovibrionaceae bacterium]|nr:hypothetical protein [Pseudobdellovibrionaceae bacterium]